MDIRKLCVYAACVVKTNFFNFLRFWNSEKKIYSKKWKHQTKPNLFSILYKKLRVVNGPAQIHFGRVRWAVTGQWFGPDLKDENQVQSTGFKGPGPTDRTGPGPTGL